MGRKIFVDHNRPIREEFSGGDQEASYGSSWRMAGLKVPRGKEAFERKLYIFKWLETHYNVCDGCGVITPLYASVYQQPFSLYEAGDTLWFCENCWHKLHD